MRSADKKGTRRCASPLSPSKLKLKHLGIRCPLVLSVPQGPDPIMSSKYRLRLLADDIRDVCWKIHFHCFSVGILRRVFAAFTFIKDRLVVLAPSDSGFNIDPAAVNGPDILPLCSGSPPSERTNS